MNGLYDSVDCFWGNGAVADLESVGMAKAWNWLKAQSGNTHPGATMPFGWVSALPYSGNYPTGYGVVGCSSDRPAPLVSDRKTAWGITHFHLSGPGFMGYFYNYMLVTPSVPGADTASQAELHDETARPGWYAAEFREYGVRAELTCGKFAACHRYKFAGNSGRIVVDGTNLGLRCPTPIHYSERVEFLDFQTVEPGVWHGFVEAHLVRLFFALRVKGDITGSRLVNGKLELEVSGDAAELTLAFSLNSPAEADARAREAAESGFERIKAAAVAAWKERLERVRADFRDDRQREIFASALYHSLVKPSDAGDRYIDFHTMWDIYRTQLPLMQAICPADAKTMLRSMLDTIHTLGFFPNGYQMCWDYHKHDNQATALVLYVLADGFFRGLLTAADYPRLKSAVKLELARADVRGKSPTHKLDLAGALAALAQVADACGDTAFADELTMKIHIWRQAYDPETGLLVADAVYYEGTHWNYSFRPHPGMARRIALAGGREKFTALLEEFFCVGSTKTFAEARPMHHDHFEGMNNESDMETPYCWLWAGRSDRLAEVSDLIRRCRFTTGEGGCPGNNDTGALSSWYVWCCLGIYPLTGTPYYLLGSPSVERAEIDLPGGTLKIAVERESAASIYPAGYEFNGKTFSEPWLKLSELEAGGTLKFRLTDRPNGSSPIPDWL